MGIKQHPFFETVEYADKIFREAKVWGAGNANRRMFYGALKEAHPFVFDRTVTMEKRMAGRACENVEQLVEDFSLPFSTSLYLMTDSPEFLAPDSEGSDLLNVNKNLGYLIKEVSPETFTCWEICRVSPREGRFRHDAKNVFVDIPVINQFNLNLKDIQVTMRMAKALGAEIFDKKTEAHLLKEMAAIMNFTDCISVKRIGVEKPRAFNMKTKDIGVGITTYKYDNIIHIADKVEYEYVAPLDDSSINWEHVGFWRGHWRAFYVKTSTGDNRKDENGWNTVDYGRIGKDRTGHYCVPGYTWVVEHTKGNPDIAEIKTRTVKHGRN